MNGGYQSFISFGRTLAQDRGIKWEIALDQRGRAGRLSAWNLTELVKGSPPPTHWLSDLGSDTTTLKVINRSRQNADQNPTNKTALSSGWQDLIKAATLEQLLVRRNTTGHVISNIIRPLRVLATCCPQEPWELRSQDISQCYAVAVKAQPSGKLADTVLSVVKVVIDANQICEAGLLYPGLRTYSRIGVRSKRAKFLKSTDELRENLEDRKKAERLPEKRAFWELVRIVFTEQPKTFIDLLHFAHIKVLLLCGLRVGEASLLPVDWKRVRQYHDNSGRPPAELGGYSEALMLRHFAEKQQRPNSESTLLVENTQYVPEIFKELLTNALDQVVNATKPLRETLKLQVQKKRFLPWYETNQLVPLTELYTILTGNPIILDLNNETVSRYRARYQKNFDPEIFDEILDHQLDNAILVRFKASAYTFFNRLKGKLPIYRDRNDYSRDWHGAYVRIGEVEEYLRRETPTKISDTTAFQTSSGELSTWELMFLMPKRSVSESRNEGLCDITRYWSVGRFDPKMVTNFMSGSNPNTPSLFKKYGHSESDRVLALNPHSLRHLQNTELFRIGVADTIISKRFNRRSVAQSYEYDHRSLSEELGQIEIPADVEVALGEKASTVARLIKAGKASGPLVQAFKEIQQKEGDDAAFSFLKVEADGFHSTPYGHCINSFTVDPCPKHLECFAGCRHLTATDLPENRRNLLLLEGRLLAALEQAQARPAKSIGRDNQIKHTEEKLYAVRRLLSTPHGHQVFPDGPDLSNNNITERSVLDD